DINFSASPETGEVKPVIQVGLLRDLGVDVPRLMRDNLIASNLENNMPLDVPGLIPGASVEFDVNNLALLVSIP
ncbi:FimD/PapC N-terminal domain-containing protein, partial [Pseudomonas aeruginosa]